MSKALEKRSENALAPPHQEEVSAPLVAIALSNESYLQRVWKAIVWQTEEYVKMDFAYSVVAAVFMGALALLWERRIETTALYFGIIGFLVVFVARFGQHVVVTPQLIDSATRNALNKCEQRNAELTKHKVVFEIDEALTRVYLHDESPSVVRLTADISLFFVSRDASDWSLKRLDVTLHRLVPNNPVEVDAYHFMRYRRVSGDIIDSADFERMVIHAGTKTPTYIATGHISIGEEIKKASELDSLCFLRVTMEATGNQPPLHADLFLDWKDALSVEGARPTFIMGVETVNKITDRRMT